MCLVCCSRCVCHALSVLGVRGVRRQAEEEAHPPSMTQLAHLLYWGLRGFGRDQARARRLWDGEGSQQNVC